MTTGRYLTLARESTGEVREKASRFFAYAFPIADEDMFKQQLARVAKEHHAARHLCYGWVLGTTGGRFRAFDAGEPAGSAGKPILRQLQGAGLTQCAIVVARYFGGTLLGKAGLARAFADAAKAALANNTVVERQPTTRLVVQCSYAEEDAVRKEVERPGGEVHGAVYGGQCTLHVAIPVSHAETLRQRWSLRGIITECETDPPR